MRKFRAVWLGVAFALLVAAPSGAKVVDATSALAGSSMTLVPSRTSLETVNGTNVVAVAGVTCNNDGTVTASFSYEGLDAGTHQATQALLETGVVIVSQIADGAGNQLNPLTITVPRPIDGKYHEYAARTRLPTISSTAWQSDNKPCAPVYPDCKGNAMLPPGTPTPVCVVPTPVPTPPPVATPTPTPPPVVVVVIKGCDGKTYPQGTPLPPCNKPGKKKPLPKCPRRISIHTIKPNSHTRAGQHGTHPFGGRTTAGKIVHSTLRVTAIGQGKPPVGSPNSSLMRFSGGTIRIWLYNQKVWRHYHVWGNYHLDFVFSVRIKFKGGSSLVCNQKEEFDWFNYDPDGEALRT
jgi:hypothetical protein